METPEVVKDLFGKLNGSENKTISIYEIIKRCLDKIRQINNR